MKKGMDQEVQKELEELSPLLAKMRKQDTGFRIPDGYFQKFTNQILDATIHSPSLSPPETKEKDLWYSPLLSALAAFLQPRYAMAMAAFTLLLVAGILWLTPNDTGILENMAWSDISTEEMTRYIEANIQEFDLSSIVDIAPYVERQSILNSTDIEEEILDGYLEEIMDEVELEDLETLF